MLGALKGRGGLRMQKAVNEQHLEGGCIRVLLRQ